MCQLGSELTCLSSELPPTGRVREVAGGSGEAVGMFYPPRMTQWWGFPFHQEVYKFGGVFCFVFFYSLRQTMEYKKNTE